MHVHLDAIGGVAGDMFLAAVLDARPDLAAGALEAMRAVGLPATWAAELVDHKADGLTGRRFKVEPPARHGSSHAHHHHQAVTFKDIRGMIERGRLDAPVKARAIAIFRLLAEAEGAVHGKAVDEVHFHEVADWDSVADIVGAAFVIEALAATWSVSALPLGGGRVKTAHGILPVPAPATARLLEGFEAIDDGVAGERVTPTGAAILKNLAPVRRRPAGLTLKASGTGFGTKAMPGLPNILRALLFDASAGRGEAPPATAGEVAVLAFEVDDQTPEDLAVGLDKLRARADVLDVTQAPVFGKKGRMMMAVQVLCRPAAVEAVATACFAETTTIGLRWQVARRFELKRTVAKAGGVRVKVASRPGGRKTAKAEAEDLRDAAGGRQGRAKVRGKAEAAALKTRKGKTRKA